MKISQKFYKEERLKRKALIDRLFQREGDTFAVYPLRLIWLETELESRFPVQITFSVPKKLFPRAVDRNRIKRQMKEIFRLHKNEFYQKMGNEKQFAMMLIYTGKQKIEYHEIEEKLNIITSKFIDRVITKK